MSTIKLKRSAVEGKVPGAEDLELGELAINTFDGKLYLKRSAAGSNSVVDVTSGSGLSAQDILDQIKTVDGAGSGLDADLLDGANSTFYLDYNNFSNTPVIGDASVTFSGDSVVSASGSFSLNDTVNSNVSLSVNTAAISITESQISDLQDYLTSETVTSLSLSTNILTYTDENGANTDIDLNLYLDDTNLARLVSGTVAANGVATFTRDDASTFTVDFSDLLDDTNTTYDLVSPGTSGVLRLSDNANANDDITFIGSGATTVSSNSTHIIVSSTDTNTDTNNYLDSASFNTTNGVLTLGRLGLSDVAVDLDGRFLLSSEFTATANTWLATRSTTNLQEGTNLYYTTSRANSAIDSRVTQSFVNALNVDANTATALATSRTIALGGDVSGSASFDGSSNITITASVADDSHNHVISNIDGLQSTLDGKLDSSDIGTNVLAYDSNLQSFVSTFTLPTIDGTNGQVLTTNGSGGLTFTTISGYTDADVDTHLNTSTATTDQVLSWNGSDYDWVDAGSTDSPVGTITGNATLDLSTGTVFEHTPTADTTFVFNNPPASGAAYGFTLKVAGNDLPVGYDLANASYDSVGFSSGFNNVYELFFKPDGTKMYVVSQNPDSVNEYDLSTAWDFSTASYSQSFSVSTQDSSPAGLFFKPDGTKMYVVGDGFDNVYEYDLSTAWDVSTASYLQNFSLSVSSPTGLFFKPDGTKMYVVFRSVDSVYEYDLSAAWDVSTASFVQDFSISAQEFQPFGLFFKPDGTKMYVIGIAGDDVNEYDLSTAWDVSTASFVQDFSVSAQEASPTGMFFKTDGTKMYVVGINTDNIYQYSTTGTPAAPATFTYPASVVWDKNTRPTDPADGDEIVLSFLTTDGGTTYYGDVEYDSRNLGIDISDVNGLQSELDSALQSNDNVSELNNDANYISTLGTLTKTFFEGETVTITLSSNVSPTAIVGVTKEYIQSNVISKGSWNVSANASNYELYDQAPSTSLTISGAWDVSVASFVTNFRVADQDTNPTDVFFKPDGTKMYMIGRSLDFIHEYDLSTPWDVSSASHSQSLSIGPQESGPTGLFFKPDGTKMYVVGYVGIDVNEYDLSTAWDISSASYLQNFSVSAQETGPMDLFFKPDGTKMYITGTSGSDVNEYDLSTAWDISSASYLQNFSVSAQENSTQGLFFKPDGTKMYIIGTSGDDVNEYDLSTAWDVSSASYLQNFNVSAQENSPQGLFFKPDGTKMYIVGNSGYDVNEYDIALSATLGSGSFTSDDVGKRIFTDDGSAVIADGTNGSLVQASGFESQTYTSGNWSLTGLDVDPVNGITLSGIDKSWDISSASYLQNFDVSAQETNPQGLFFKPDGTKMYIVGTSGDDVNEYDLSTAWDISSASYLQNFSVFAQETNPQGLFFKPDGTKMYVVGYGGDEVNEYDLSTAWDISSASYLQNFSVSADGHSNPSGISFKPDGTKMYVVGYTKVAVSEYDLSTAWDISSASYLQNFSVFAQETNPQGLFFKPDGTKMYVVGYVDGDEVNEYDLSTAWDISSASYLQNFNVSAQEFSPRGLFFKPDGTKMYIVGNNGDEVNEYDIGPVLLPTNQYLPAITSTSGQIDSTNWTDINSMTADDADNDGEVYYAVSTDDRTSWSVAKANRGVRNIVRNNSGTWQYNTSTGAWDISSITFNQNFSVSAQETAPQGLFFKPDGTKMYVVGYVDDEVNEYDLSTAWDISSITFNQNFSVSAQEFSPRGLFFKPDGTKMYIVGNSGDEVNEYDLSTAWDISTASYLQDFSVSSQGGSPIGLFFKPDGTKMYLTDYGGDEVNEYDLSTAWDVSSASYNQRLSVRAEESTPSDLFFKPDGTKMYIVGNVGDNVNEYDLSTAWDISSASYLQNFSVFAQESSPRGLFFKPDGTKMYIVGDSGDDINEYDIGEYSTQEQWANATINGEFSALEQAMTIEGNKMNKTQIDAISDASHIILGDTLDLAIIPYIASDGVLPTSDGVSINHDIAGLNKGAILGTDYDYDLPTENQVRITALADLNLKIRVA